MPETPDQIEESQVSKVSQVTREKTAKDFSDRDAQVLFTFSLERRQAIARMVCKDAEADETAMQSYMKRIEEAMELYEQEREDKVDPFIGSSNVSAGDVPIAVENMHPRILGGVWTEDIARIESNDPSSRKNIHNIRSLADWIYRVDMSDLYEKIDEHCHSTILYGTQVVWIRWDVERHMITEFEDEEQEQEGEGKPKVTVQKVVQKPIFHERAYWENLNLEDFFIPVHECGDHHKMSHNIRRYYMTHAQLSEFVARKGIKLKDDSGKELDLTVRVDEWLNKQYGEEVKRLKQSGFSDPEIRTRYRLEILDWHGLYDANDDGFREECLFMVIRSLDLYIMGQFQSTPDGKRPFEVDRLIPRKNFFYGIGIPELIRHLAAERDAIHNQRVDAGAVSLIPFGFYRAASGFRPEKVVLQPGSWVPLDDINDARFVQYTNPGQILAPEEAMLQNQIEKLTIAGSAQLGRESEILKTRATAKGTQLMVGQGNIRFSLYGKRVAKAIARMLDRILIFYQTFFPLTDAEKVIGRDGSMAFPKGLTREQLIGRFTNYITGDTESSNKSVSRQISTMLLQILLPSPFMQTSPARMWEAYADVLREYNRPDVKKYLGPRPPDQMDPLELVQDMIEDVKQGYPITIDQKSNVLVQMSGLTLFTKTDEFRELDRKQQKLIISAIRNAQEELRRRMDQAINQNVPQVQEQPQEPLFIGEEEIPSGIPEPVTEEI